MDLVNSGQCLLSLMLASFQFRPQHKRRSTNTCFCKWNVNAWPGTACMNVRGRNNTSETDVALWCYNWDGMGDGWDGSPGGVRYRAPYGADNRSQAES